MRQFRLKELACVDKMAVIRCGMATVIPVQVLRVLTAGDLNLRVCGIPDVDLKYLKVGFLFCLTCLICFTLTLSIYLNQLHTTYHVGLMEEDRHIKYFWNALGSFSQVNPMPT